MANILILIGGHLFAAPCPKKEAETLAIAGLNVTVGSIGSTQSSSIAIALKI